MTSLQRMTCQNCCVNLSWLQNKAQSVWKSATRECWISENLETQKRGMKFRCFQKLSVANTNPNPETRHEVQMLPEAVRGKHCRGGASLPFENSLIKQQKMTSTVMKQPNTVSCTARSGRSCKWSQRARMTCSSILETLVPHRAWLCVCLCVCVFSSVCMGKH